MRREPATLTRSLLVLALSLSTACVETVSCPEGEGISEDAKLHPPSSSCR